jgi:hypothetical protein
MGLSYCGLRDILGNDLGKWHIGAERIGQLVLQRKKGKNFMLEHMISKGKKEI